ncbi:MAG: DUF2171 domain-containing protein [Sphingomonas sp.]
MIEAQQIKAGMTVVDSCGERIGTVMGVHDAIVELKREGFPERLHHFVPVAAVRALDDEGITVDAGEATTVEAVIAAIGYARSRAPQRAGAIFGTSGHGTGMGGAGIGG